jgi:hypothetical protein
MTWLQPIRRAVGGTQAFHTADRVTEARWINWLAGAEIWCIWSLWIQPPPSRDGGGKVWNRRNLAIGGHIGLWRRCNIRDAGIQPNPARRTELVLTRPWSRLMSIAQT